MKQLALYWLKVVKWATWPQRDVDVWVSNSKG